MARSSGQDGLTVASEGGGEGGALWVRHRGLDVLLNPRGELLGHGVEIPLGLVAGDPFDATDGIGQEELVGLNQVLGRQGSFVNLHVAVDGGADQHRAHDAAHASVVQARRVQDAVGDDEQIRTRRLDDPLLRIQHERIAPATGRGMACRLNVDGAGHVFEFADGRGVLDHVLVDVHVQAFGGQREPFGVHGRGACDPSDGVGLGGVGTAASAAGCQADADVLVGAPGLAPNANGLAKGAFFEVGVQFNAVGLEGRMKTLHVQTQEGDVARREAHRLEDAIAQREPTVAKRFGQVGFAHHRSVHQECVQRRHGMKIRVRFSARVGRVDDVLHGVEQGGVGLDEDATDAHGRGRIQVALLVADHP